MSGIIILVYGLVGQVIPRLKPDGREILIYGFKFLEPEPELLPPHTTIL
jgi:hypothetical protein